MTQEPLLASLDHVLHLRIQPCRGGLVPEVSKSRIRDTSYITVLPLLACSKSLGVLGNIKMLTSNPRILGWGPNLDTSKKLLVATNTIDPKQHLVAHCPSSQEDWPGQEYTGSPVDDDWLQMRWCTGSEWWDSHNRAASCYSYWENWRRTMTIS